MTRKDYILLAGVLNKLMIDTDLDPRTIATVSNGLATELVKENPGFCKKIWDKAVLMGVK